MRRARETCSPAKARTADANLICSPFLLAPDRRNAAGGLFTRSAASAKLIICRPPGGANVTIFSSFRGSAATEESTNSARHSEPAPAGEESPGWFHQGNDNGSENIARHSCALHGNPPPMVCTGSDNALLCPSAGDPRFARMTEKIHGSPASTFPHPQRVSCKGAMFKISYFSIHKKDINGC